MSYNNVTATGSTLALSICNVSTECTTLVNSTSALAGQCKWTSLNTAFDAFLLLTILINVSASLVLFRVPLVTVRGRSNPVYLCIRFLNISDIIQALLLFVMPFFSDRDCIWIGGEANCRFMGFMALSLLLVSPFITILMAFDRVVALYQPFRYRSHLGLKMLKVLLPVACILVLVMTILPVFGIGEYHVVRGRRLCLLDTITEDAVDRIYVLIVHSMFLLALIFMALCTFTFQFKLVSMSFEKKHKNALKNKSSAKRTRNATITTMAVCGLFIVCYMPYVCRVLAEASSGKKSPVWATWLTFGLAFTQPLLNPVVYVMTNVRYRHELQVLLRRMKRIDIDISSDSATATRKRSTHSVEDRKKNKRENGKGKEFQESVISGDHDRNCKKNRKSSTRKSEGENEVFNKDPTSKSANQVNRDRYILPPVVRRKPSSSSGVRSSGSDYAISPGYRQFLRFPTENMLKKTSEEQAEETFFGGEVRRRSHTISEGQTKLLSIIEKPIEMKRSLSSSNFPSLPVTPQKIPKNHLDTFDVISLDKSPRFHCRTQNPEFTEEIKSLLDDVFALTDISNHAEISNNNKTVKMNLAILTQHNTNDASETLIENQQTKPQSGFLKKKPSHRDSGMVDMSDPSA